MLSVSSRLASTYSSHCIGHIWSALSAWLFALSAWLFCSNGSQVALTHCTALTQGTALTRLVLSEVVENQELAAEMFEDDDDAPLENDDWSPTNSPTDSPR